MSLVDTAGRPFDEETVKQAFLLETLAPYGRIYDFCRVLGTEVPKYFLIISLLFMVKVLLTLCH